MPAKNHNRSEKNQKSLPGPTGRDAKNRHQRNVVAVEAVEALKGAEYRKVREVLTAMEAWHAAKSMAASAKAAWEAAESKEAEAKAAAVKAKAELQEVKAEWLEARSHSPQIMIRQVQNKVSRLSLDGADPFIRQLHDKIEQVRVAALEQYNCTGIIPEEDMKDPLWAGMHAKMLQKLKECPIVHEDEIEKKASIALTSAFRDVAMFLIRERENGES